MCRTEREAIIANDQIRFADALASVNARRTADLERMHLQKFVDEGRYQSQLAAQVSKALLAQNHLYMRKQDELFCFLFIKYKHCSAMMQGLAEGQADEAASHALRRLDLLNALHTAVTQHQDANRKQAAAHQAIVDRQVPLVDVSSRCNKISNVKAVVHLS